VNADAPRPVQVLAQPCEKHPAWAVDVRSKPSPPSSSCPYCLREALVNRVTERETVTIEMTRMPDRLEELQYRFEQKHDVQVNAFAGSMAEEEAVRISDELRAEELAREARENRRRGRVTTRFVGSYGDPDWRS